MTNIVESTIGGNGADYSTIQEWEDATSSINLVSDDLIHIGIITNTGQFLFPNNFLHIKNSGVTSESNYRQLVASEVSGYWNQIQQTGVLIGSVSGGISGGQDWFRLGPGIAVEAYGSDNTWVIDLTGNGILIDSVIVRNVTGGLNGIRIQSDGNDASDITGAIVNTIVYGEFGDNRIGICVPSGAILSNNTVYSVSGGIGVCSGTVFNIASFIDKDGTCFSGTNDNYCASSDATASGFGGKINLSSIHQFWSVTDNAEDFRVKSKTYSSIYRNGYILTEDNAENLTGQIDALNILGSGEFKNGFYSALSKDIGLTGRPVALGGSENWDIGAYYKGTESILNSTGSYNSDDFNWYKSIINSVLFTGQAGGAASTDLILSGPQDLCPTLYSNSGFQFRKVFLESNSSLPLYETRVYLKHVEYLDQVSIAKEKIGGDLAVSATGYPSGYSSADFYSPYTYSGGLVLGTLTSGSSSGVWIRIDVTGNLYDPQAGFFLTAEGYPTEI